MPPSGTGQPEVCDRSATQRACRFPRPDSRRTPCPGTADVIGDPERKRHAMAGFATATPRRSLDHGVELHEAVEGGHELGWLPALRLLRQPLHPECTENAHRPACFGEVSCPDEAVSELGHLADTPMEDHDD